MYRQSYSQYVLTYTQMAYLYASVCRTKTFPDSVYVCDCFIHYVNIILDTVYCAFARDYSVAGSTRIL